MAKIALQDVVAHVTKMITGTKKRYPTGSTVLSFGNTTHTVDDVTGSLQTLVTNRSNVEAADNAQKVAIEAERTALPALLALLAAYTKFVRATCGTSADALADFDLTPPKTPAPKTAEEKSGHRREASGHARVARGTTSAKQKKSVKGNVTAKLVVTPAARPLLRQRRRPRPRRASTTPSGGTPAAHS